MVIVRCGWWDRKSHSIIAKWGDSCPIRPIGVPKVGKQKSWTGNCELILVRCLCSIYWFIIFNSCRALEDSFLGELRSGSPLRALNKLVNCWVGIPRLGCTQLIAHGSCWRPLRVKSLGGLIWRTWGQLSYLKGYSLNISKVLNAGFFLEQLLAQQSLQNF